VLASEDIDFIKKEYERENIEKKQYRRQMFEVQERLAMFERMKDDYEKLYSEFLIKSITAEKQKIVLEKRLIKVNFVLAKVSGCNKECVKDWADYQKMTKRRAMIIGGVVLGLILIIILCS